MSEYTLYWYNQDNLHYLRNLKLTKVSENVYTGNYTNWLGIKPSWKITVTVDTRDRTLPDTMTINDLISYNLNWYADLVPVYHIMPFLKSKFCITIDKDMNVSCDLHPTQYSLDASLV